MSRTDELHAPTRRPSACRRFLRHLHRSEQISRPGAGGPPAGWEEHLAGCAACREEARRDRIVTAALLHATEGQAPSAGTLSPARRRLVLERGARRAGLGWGLLPLIDWRPAAGLAAAAVAALVLGTLTLPPGAPRQEPVAPALAARWGGPELRVSTGPSGVRLSWGADGRTEHRVLRATDPRDLAAGRVAVVKGNEWVDPEANGARVVFYAVD